ncbi:hypothetical protein IPA_06930 [Ignicoccus pacificus DSM 13166]|uniref:Uncharacterized protein n=1 Tax=Ignicoccus pacificus DSM 13166 TaxID=940294 RepID=A0A977KBJ7_9CREN|nr:hypothetical protein IPA_06930 [Ignicoccus pacificus DSM 13166]
MQYVVIDYRLRKEGELGETKGGQGGATVRYCDSLERRHLNLSRSTNGKRVQLHWRSDHLESSAVADFAHHSLTVTLFYQCQDKLAG